MADQDAQDINQMMSQRPEVLVAPPRKSMFLWVVLGCVVVGVGLGVVVYQQSIKPIPVLKTTPKPTLIAIPSPVASPTEVPLTPNINVVNPASAVLPVSNVMTFPESGKLRVFSDLNNLTLVITLTTGNEVKTLTLPNRVVDVTKKMNFSDSTFSVTAGSTASVSSYLNKTTGPKMLGWILPSADNKCGANGSVLVDIVPKITWAQANLVTGKTIFAKQCWADVAETDPASNGFNEFLLLWSYAPATASPSVAPSTTASPSPSASAIASPSPSVAASVAPTPTPAASPRVTMPDTSEGTPVTGVFEVTVGTVSVGLILLVLGLFGLLAL